MKQQTGWSPDEQIDAIPDEDGLADPGPEYSTIELIQLAFDEGKLYAATEMERQRLRAGLLGAAGRDVAILGFIALFLLAGALVALLVGCIWALGELIGPLLATLVVGGVTLVIVALLVGFARARVRSALRLAFGKEEQA